MTLPSSATIFASHLQKRFISLWLSRSIPLHGTAPRTFNRGSLRKFHPNVITTTQTTSQLEQVSKLAIPPDATKDVSHTNKEQSSKATTKAKKLLKRPKIDWTPEAGTLILELRTVHNKTWLEIGRKLSIEPATCMARFESVLNPALKEFWTAERDKKLDELVTSSKGWPEIAEILGVHRLACMERWRQLGLKEVVQGDRGVPDGIQTSLKMKEHQQKDQRLHLEVQQRIKAQDLLNDLRNTSSTLKTIRQVDKDHDQLGWNLLLRDEHRYHHHRSWKKKSQLDNFSQLYLLNPGWSAKEETILIQFVLRHGLDKWEILAKEMLDNRFTASQCRTCWKNLDMPAIDSQATGDVDQTTATESSPSNPRKHIDDSLTEQASKHERNAWPKDQQIQFWRLWNQHGQDWEKIAKSIGGNISTASCEKYFSDITKQLLHHSGSVVEIDNNKEKINAFAMAITKDFRDSPAQLSVLGNAPMTEANISPIPRTRSPFVWDKEMSVRLQVIIRQTYKSKIIHIDDINWKWVSQRVHPDASPRVCKNHWNFIHANPNQVVWKHEDIKKLEEGIRLLGPKRMTQIRDHFLPNMSKDDILRHWFRISDKATSINEEDYFKLLRTADDIIRSEETSEVTQNQRWIEISKKMGAGWKKLPCMRVWESSYTYLIHHTHWTEKEDTLLLRVVRFVGRDDWFTVAKAMQINRSPWQCRLRWCQLLDPVDLNSSDLFVNGEKYC